MRSLARALFFCGLLLAGFAPLAAAKTILVIAPHPDDEVLVAGGRIRDAVLAGDTVKVIVVTNGDINGVDSGITRQGESVSALELLGLAEQDVIFLGYPDGAMPELYNASSPTTVITSPAGRTSTYGTRGLGGMDYHSYRFGSPGAYNRVTAEQDVRELISTLRPDEIYTVSHFDVHGDHAVTALLVTEALVALKRSGVALSTKLYQGLVWPPSQDNWPEAGACMPDTPFPPPGMDTQIEWKRVLRSTVLANLKCQAIAAYSTAVTPHLLSFGRKDEFFWLSDFGANLAFTAQVSVSTENTANGRLRAVDGVVNGAPLDATREWVSANQLNGAWIQLAWPAPVSIAQVNLYDRPLGNENVLSGTLSFSDGSSLPVGALLADGKMVPVTFAPKTVTWMRFTINQAEGTATGLSEIQVLGASTNVPPHFLEGPGGNTDTVIASTTSANLSVLAHDLNGDPIEYQWSADGGTINANGPNAVFTPPTVSATTVFTIAALALDGQGGSARNIGFVTVTPSADTFSVSPASVLAGDGAQGTISLASPAPAGGLSVALSSSHPAASLPASVIVPAGAASMSFPVTTTSVGTRTTVTLSANIHGTPHTTTLVVNPRPGGALPPGNLMLSSDSVGDGSWMIFGSLASTLNFGPAPDGTSHASRVVSTAAGGHALVQGVTVAPNSDYTFSFYAKNNGGTAASYSVHCLSLGVDIVPPTPYIGSISSASWTEVSTTFTTPAGCTSIFVYPLRDSGTPVNILLWRATLVPAAAAQPGVQSLVVAPANVTGGTASVATVTLSGPAPSGGAQVALASNNGAASVPASVTVAAGTNTATFPITTSAVAAATSVTISASFGGTTQTAALTIQPPVVGSLSLAPATLTGGANSVGTVSLSGPAPAGGAQVALSSSNPAAATPASVTVPAGATSATFNVSTTPVASSTTATITATYGGATQSTSLTVLPPVVTALAVNPTSVTGSISSVATVNLSGPAPAGGAQVTLSSNNPAASVASTVTVPAGATSATFSVTTIPVANTTVATLSASYGGATRTTTLTVLPPAVSDLALNPSSVVGGPLVGGSTGTVTLNGPAPAGGAQVALSSNSGAASVPSSVTIPAGATSANFSVSTAVVLSTTNATITASYKGSSRNANLQVRPVLGP